MKRKDIIEFEVGKMEFGGVTRTPVDGKRVKMKGGITGQKVRAAVKKARGERAEAKLLEVLEKSPFETEETCEHFGECGGCSMLSVGYEKQLEIKKNQVMELFEKAGIEGFEFDGIEGSPEIFGYRNKMEYTFGNEMKDGPLTLGMHKKGRHMDIVTVNTCRIVDGDFIKILENTLEYFSDRNTPFYRTRSHEGYLRHLVVRKGINTKEIMVNIVTSSQIDLSLEENSTLIENFKDMILSLELDAEVVSILHTVNDNLADTVQADSLEILYGRDFIYEEVLGLKFKISPFSFFQTNTKGAEKLYSIAREYAGIEHRNVIYDLYSGTGTIGQVMADCADEVYGIELVEEAVEAANMNAKLNGLEKCRFIAGDVAKKVNELGKNPDLIIVDPPRVGISTGAVRDIAGFGSETIVYISCNPNSLVENLVQFEQLGYKTERVTLMDMFASTPHVECVVLMSRVEK